MNTSLFMSLEAQASLQAQVWLGELEVVGIGRENYSVISEKVT